MRHEADAWQCLKKENISSYGILKIKSLKSLSSAEIISTLIVKV